MSASQSSGYGASLLHATQVFDMFTRTRRTVSVGEIATALGVHKSNGSRIAAALAGAGYLQPVEEEKGKYRLAWKFVELGEIALGNTDLLAAASRPLAALAEDLGDTAHMGVGDGLEAVTVAVVDGWHAIRMHSYVGKRSPSHCSAMGKVLLAGMDAQQVDQLLRGATLEGKTGNTITSPLQLRRELARVRTQGYATDMEELEEGMCCVAAPVFYAAGEVLASVSVSGPTSRVFAETIDDRARRVIQAAWQVSRALRAPHVVPGWPAEGDAEERTASASP